MLVAAAACGGGDGSAPNATPAVDESKPFFQADGPLHAVLVGVHEDGRPRDPSPRFKTADTEVNAYVGLGDSVEEKSILVVSWYRRTVYGEREHLFSHRIEVEPNRVARSQGVARSGLAPGIYETVATLGDWQVRTPWLVTEVAAEERSLSSAGAAQASSAPPEAGFGALDDWPWGEEQASDPPPSASRDDGPCSFGSVSVRTLVFAQVRADWSGRCERVTIGASVAGLPETLVTLNAPEYRNELGDLFHSAAGESDFCDLPGGSDLPGTVVRGVATDSGGASQSGQGTLRDAGEALQAAIDTVPERNSRVEAGDRIAVQASGLLFPAALGVRVLYLNANDELIESVPNLSGTAEPRSCDHGRLVAYLRTEYRVPPDPPPVIELCANAVGFDGTESTECVRFYTGEVWEGTWEGGLHVPAPCSPSFWPAVGTVSLTVSADGSVSGEAELVNHTGVCGGTDVPREVRAGGKLTGRLTEEAFELELILPGLGVQPITLPRSGNEAAGEFTLPTGPGSSYEARIELKCATCE
jgi:hypothetical protein